MVKTLLCLLLLSSVSVAQEIRHEISSLQQQRIDLMHAQKRLLEEINSLETMLQELTVKITKKEEALTLRQATITAQLPLLIRLARTNTLRLLIDPSISKHTIHSVILMRAFTSSLKKQILTLQKEMMDTATLSKELETKTQKHLRILQEVEAQQKELSTLKEQKIQAWQTQEQGRLANETDSNTILAEGQATLSKEKREAQKATLAQGLPFRRLEYPVVGEIVTDPALQKKFSPNSQGVVFRTSKNADVSAPSKGKIVFKGPFLSHDEIIILDHGDNVHTVFMGMSKMSAEIGQTVYAGEVLGSMAGYGKDLPLLYMELRKNGKAINPRPYFTH